MQLTSEQRRRFDEEGYVILDDVLSPEQVQQLIGALDAYLDEIDKPRTDHLFCGAPDIAWLLAHPPVMEALDDLLGPGFAYGHDSDGVRGAPVGWHRDWEWLQMSEYQPDDMIIKCCYYLEDQSPEGGCLVIRPRSHLPEHQEQPSRDEPDREYEDQLDCRTKAGSVLIFQLRMWHRSRPRALPGERHAIFCTYGKMPSELTTNFVKRWSKGLPYPAHLRNHPSPRIASLLRLER